MGKPSRGENIELESDAWQRFERFVRAVAKAGPQHRKPTEQPPKRGRKPKDDSKKPGH